ncbi:Alpha/beta hydrolase family protein [Nakamurella panacisegetis]|uniref:Alpha/beta hydrolase family protein n=2 Tax=Nakamurella panacisegetis TaxID=1090615 RepID=A0A1H0KME0_9ACTN|nr:Alpha/beta hydrolase family protein [Nakamurella panacisegetis]
MARQRATRLVVFVHGFGGHAISTWQQFDMPGDRDWWAEADMLFVGYDSLHENTLGVVHRLLHVFPDFFPLVPEKFRFVLGMPIRDGSDPYDELILVGHSLGGVILRRLVVALTKEWHEAASRVRVGNTAEGFMKVTLAMKPPLLKARLVLFSPATQGFFPTGWLTLGELMGLGRIASFLLRKSPTYSELDPKRSQLLANTRDLTEELAKLYNRSVPALHPDVLWANPDTVVQVEDYKTDRNSNSVPGQSHVSICKPSEAYSTPWELIENGGS